MNRQEITRDVQEFFGMVPGYIQSIPDQHLEHMWMSMRKLQLEEGVIPAKYQQLIMLGVSTYAKCKYCTDFHTEAAKMMGATKEEIAETAMLVGHTAEWSNFLGGIQYDFDTFKKEVRAACSNMAKSQPAKGNGGKHARA